MEYLTVDQTAALVGVSHQAVRQACAAGKLRNAARFGRAWAIPRKLLLASAPLPLTVPDPAAQARWVVLVGERKGGEAPDHKDASENA